MDDRNLDQGVASSGRVVEVLKKNYVVVMIDVNEGRNHDLCVNYGQPHVLPTIVVVEDEGRKLTTSNPEDWNEEHHYSAGKVLAFLNVWAPKK